MSAILEGCQLGQLDERERLAILAMNIGYFNNDKKPKYKKIMNKKAEEAKIIGQFEGEKVKRKYQRNNVIEALQHFSNQ